MQVSLSNYIFSKTLRRVIAIQPESNRLFIAAYRLRIGLDTNHSETTNLRLR
jgi:hypothetical protein